MPSVLLLLIPALAVQPSPAMLRGLFEQELARCKAQYGESDIRTAQAARDLGLFLNNQGDPVAARAVLAEAVRMNETALGPTHPRTLADVAELAQVSEPRQAAPLWLRAASSADAEVATHALAALGQLRENANDAAGAAEFYRRALSKEEAFSGADSARAAIRLNALARVVDTREAVTLLERALTINRRRLGGRHVETATIEVNLAGLLLKVGRAEEASRLASDAISIFEGSFGGNHPRVAVAASILGHALQLKGDAAGAERMYRRALAIDERALGPNHAETLQDTRTLAEFLRGSGRVREAADLEKRIAP